MKQNNKLNKALKNALQGQTEPLQEVQWERLTAALGEKKSRKRGFPWFILLFVAALTGLAVGYWLGNRVDKNQVTMNQKVYLDPQEPGHNEGNDKIPYLGDKKNHNREPEKIVADNGDVEGAADEENVFVKPEDNRQSDQTGVKGSAGIQELRSSGRRHTKADKGSVHYKGGIIDEKNAMDRIQALYDTNLLKKSKSNANKFITNEKEFEFKLASLQYLKMRTGRIKDTLPLYVNNKISAILKPLVIKNQYPILISPKFALSFTSGLSTVQYRISRIENNEKLHKDTRTVMDQMNKLSKSYFGSFSFDCMVSEKLPIIFSTGIQFRQIIQNVNLNYELREIPFRANDGTIWFYLTDSSSSPLIFNYAGRNYFDFVSLPIKIGYRFQIGRKNEILFSGGTNLSMMVGVKGNSVAINELEVKPLEESYRRTVNIGLTGGLQYNRNIYKPWWLGIEALWQQNAVNYDAKYGKIKSKININNYNIHLKYKF